VSSIRLLVWLGGGALAATMALGAVHNGIWPPPEKAVISYAAAFVGITIGVIVWQLRPDSRTGVLLTAWPLASLLGELPIVFSGSTVALTVGYATNWLAAPIFGHLVLSYPTGRLRYKLDRAAVGLAYALAAVFGLATVLLFDPRPQWAGTITWFQPHAAPITHLRGWEASGLPDAFDRALLPLAVLFIVLLARKLVRLAPGGRRVVLPLAVAAGFVAVQFVVQFAVLGGPVNSYSRLHAGWFWIVNGAALAVPISLAAGLLWGSRARSAIADLVVELERTPPGEVRGALARALGDPSLELALWRPDRGSYIDSQGQPFELPAPGTERAVTVLGPADAPIAALVHDPVLLERRALLTAAGAAARLALENERLQAELRAQLGELRASRARIVSAGDEERRRLERDLHDGAQQRLLSLGLALQLARVKLGPDANGASAVLAEADAELRAALDELRELARGIHPAVLTEQGLAAALHSLAGRSPVPVTIATLPEKRLPAPTETAAYFLVSEALANVAKYARATHASISVTHAEGRVLVDIDDDGVGGADPSRGTGLRGLADRVQALDGRLELESPSGHGTHLHAEIPCA
jgi:signal transduction histidine kinase